MNNHSQDLDWQWQIRNSINSIEKLKAFVPLSEDQEQWLYENSSPKLPFSLTPYFASLMDKSLECPIFAQVVLTPRELEQDPFELRDPLGEETREKVSH